MRNEATHSLVRPKAKGETRKWRAAHLKRKGDKRNVRIVLSKTLSSNDPSKPGRGPDLEGRWPGAMRNACYEERQCLAFLMSADATGATLEPGPMVLGCDGQNGLTAKGKVSIQ